MLLEAGRKYVARNGDIWTVTCVGDTCRGISEKGGPEKTMWYREGNCYTSKAYHDNDLVSEYIELIWSYCPRDRAGIWAYGGSEYNKKPVLISVSSHTDCIGMCAWRCYLGPRPTINTKKMEVLWLCKTVTSRPDVWFEEWVEEGKFPEGFKHDKSDIERFVKTERTRC